MNLQLGDSLEVLKGIEDNFVDAVVTDSPYGLKFMSKKWDYDVPSVELWREVLRVLKPGGHLLSFGGTRTYHRMAVAIEDADFEIRDQIMWLYGSGFPKSHDVSKAIDKKFGAEREVIGSRDVGPDIRGNNFKNDSGERMISEITAPSTYQAKQWQGWGSALKPANEPIVLARKPLEKGLTIAENVLKWGVGGLNIDGCRVEGKPRTTHKDGNFSSTGNREDTMFNMGDKFKCPEPLGRFPANIILDEEAAAVLDEQSGVLKSGARKQSVKKESGVTFQTGGVSACEASSGGASRFFYIAKASKRERNEGLEGMPLKEIYPQNNSLERKELNATANQRVQNFHPTVKPITLMQYLCRLITPPKGIVLDPFMGSGSTGIAALKEGFGFFGIELDPEYFEIAKARLKYTQDKFSEEYETEAEEEGA